jgi:CheY-like chemotaxis protein
MPALQPRSIAKPSLDKHARRLLVVEDEYLVAMTMADLPRDLGHSVAGPASSIEEAERLASVTHFDGALLDWKPSGNFAGAVADILGQNIPLLFVTGYDKVPDAKYGKFATLNKPFRADDPRRAVEGLLEGEKSALSTAKRRPLSDYRQTKDAEEGKQAYDFRGASSERLLLTRFSGPTDRAKETRNGGGSSRPKHP